MRSAEAGALLAALVAASYVVLMKTMDKCDTPSACMAVLSSSSE